MVLEGDTLSLDFTSFIAYFERSSTDTAFPEEKWYTEKDVYGTWKLCGVYTVSDSQYYTLAEVRKANEKLAESYFVFAQDGKGFVRIEDSEQHITWTYEDKTIIIGNAKIGCAYDLLFMTDDTYIYLFIKDSDDCTIPEKQDDIRPEFKEAMDSYEEFFKEYCEFMKKMKENPNDISLLLSYTQYMTQYAEMMQKMEAMDDGTLNDAELQYYLEVTGRITQMLYEAAL